MFKLVAERTAWWPVTWKGVTEDGEIVENRIEVKFRIVGRREFAELFLAEPQEGQSQEELDRRAAERVILDWRGIADENGKPLPFTPELRDQWLDLPMVAVATMEAYARLFAAVPEVREKNSVSSPAPGPAAAMGETVPQSRPSSPRGARRRKK